LLTDVSLLGHANPKKEGEYWLSYFGGALLSVLQLLPSRFSCASQVESASVPRLTACQMALRSVGMSFSE